MAIDLLEEEQAVRQTNADHSFPGTRRKKRGGSTHGYLRTVYDTLQTHAQDRSCPDQHGWQRASLGQYFYSQHNLYIFRLVFYKLVPYQENLEYPDDPPGSIRPITLG